MAVANSDHGAGNFRSQSPPARIADDGAHDMGMLNQTGHSPNTGGDLTPRPEKTFTMPNLPPLPKRPVMKGSSDPLFRIMPDSDTDRGF